MATELPPSDDGDLAGILDLFEEHVYAGAITPDGRYLHLAAGPRRHRVLGGALPASAEDGHFWISRVHPDDREAYERFNAQLVAGHDAEVRYRLLGLDGVTRMLWDRARPRAQPDGSTRIDGIISDVTARDAAAASLAEASDRFTRLLDVVGEHVYLALSHPDGRLEELFQGPGADRLLGGAIPDPEMTNWEAALHPDDRPAYDAFNAALAAGCDADVEYRLRGADGITRWVHDRAATRRNPDGTIEISGIVSDVTERRRMRAELARAHASLSQVVDSMDAHLYTLRVDADGGHRAIYRGPNREVLTGGTLDDETAFEQLVHVDDRSRRRAAFAGLAAGVPVEVEYRVQGLDGRERVISEQLRPRRDADGSLLFDGVGRDITERRRLEDDLRRSMAEMQEASLELERARAEAELRARTDELTGTFNRRHFSEIVEAALAADPGRCGLLLLDADHFKHVNDAYGHVVGDAVLVEFARRLQGFLGPDDCLARWGGEEFAVLLRGVRSDEELAHRAEHLRTAIARTPVSASGVTLRLTASLGAARGSDDLPTLDALVDAADRCLYDAKRHGRNRVSLVPHLQLAGTPGEPEAVCIARAMALVAASRDQACATRAHAELVASLCTRTAERLGLPVDAVLRARLGGWLHDIGKSAIPRSILDKPGPLDDAEWAVMRTHPAIGEALVCDVAALRDAAPAVRHHHERWDGGGYPDGLAGEAIPVDARIVAAADAYAAMTAERVYSAARTPREAADELRRSAGSHLDPRVVEALLDVLDLAEGPASQVA
jgi:diguanylate cyclase (GGDEF)-like protein